MGQSQAERDVLLIQDQARTYEKLRFDRVRSSQTNGEDVRDRWHNALKNVNEGMEIDPETVKVCIYHHVEEGSRSHISDQIRNRWLYAFDAEADTVKRWNDVSAKVSEELRTDSVSPLFGSISGSKSGVCAVVEQIA